MALISLVIDIAEGHLFPSFGLAHGLLRQGHEVVYVTMPDNEAFVREQGFRFYPIYEEIYPEGYRDRVKQAIREQGFDAAMMHGYYAGSVVSDSFGDFLTVLKPDMVIISCFLNMEALLLHYKYRIVPILLTPFLREEQDLPSAGFLQELMRMPGEVSVKLLEMANELGLSFTSLQHLVKPLDEFPELILCPLEMDTMLSAPRPQAYYIGPFVGSRRNDALLNFLQHIIPGKHIIYASLGSQAAVYATHIFDSFLQSLLTVMEHTDMQSFHLVCSTGIDLYERYKDMLPENITMMKWVSQTEILKHASLAIIHGGLGTVKECIYYGVPMVVIPLVSDQPSNARRVAHHRLGLSVGADELSPSRLHAVIREVFNNEDIHNNINKMKVLFHEKEAAGEGVEIIDTLLLSKTEYNESV